ncbi:hypothetical protein WDZ92_26110, partial [Nostoc sp. NIES-2111]
LSGTSKMFTGHPEEGREHLDEAFRLYQPAIHRGLATRFGVDSQVSALCNRSWALWLLGQPDAARRDCDEAIRNAREIGQTATIIYALAHAGTPLVLLGDSEACLEQSREIMNLSEQIGSRFWDAAGRMNFGCACAIAGRPREAIEAIDAGMPVWSEMGATLWMQFKLAHHAASHLQLGQVVAARHSVDEALSITARTGEVWFDPELHRVAGDIERALSGSGSQAAEAHYRHAMQLADQHGSRSLVLRAAMSLASFYDGAGEKGRALDVLAPVYATFSEGFGTRDLVAAGALLSDLR